MEEQADIVSTATSNVENNITPTITQIQSNASNALNTANTAISTANTAKSIAEGANQALSYTNYQAMITAFNELADNVYKVGQNIMIVTLNVPDLWISAIENTSITYNYTNDEAITTALSTNGYIQVGYYKLSALETQKVDLTDYYTKTGTENKIEDYLYQIMPTDSTSGAIATINDSTTMFNAVDVIGTIEPVQDLHGYDNPWAAGGGTNIWDEEWEVGDISPTTGENANSSTIIRTKNYIPIKPNTEYYFYMGASLSGNVRSRFYNANKEYLGTGTSFYYNSTFTTPSDAYYLRFTPQTNYGVEYNHDIAINYPATVTTYAPYSNICPITGWTGMNVTRTGKNLCMAPLFGLPPSFNDIATWSIKPTNYTTLAARLNELAPGNYVISCKFTLVTRNDTTDNSTHGIYLLFNDGTSFSNHNLAVNKWGTKTVGATDTVSLPITITESTAGTVKDLRFYGCGINGVGTTGSASVSNFQVEKGDTGTAYEAYQDTTYPISWQTEAGTVYSGNLDVTTGLLMATHGYLYFDGTNSVNYVLYSNSNNVYYTAVVNTINGVNTNVSNPLYSSMFKSNTSLKIGNSYVTNNGHTIVVVLPDQTITTKEQGTQWFRDNPTQFIYPLAEPVTYQLTPQEVSFLLGTNNLWVDTGDINVTYKADIQKYIDKKTN